MGAKHFTELRVWQLANRLKNEIWALTARPTVASDRRFCDDMRAAIASVCSNTAEGFARYDHREFANFLKMARGSLAETQSHLIDARGRGYMDDSEFENRMSESRQAMASLTALHRYVRSHPTPGKKDLGGGKG